MVEWKATTCPYCGTGCGLLACVKEGRVVKVKGNKNSPVNQGRLCRLGSTAHKALYKGRVLYPQIREDTSKPFRQVSWDEALEFVANKFKSVVEERGADATAFYASGQLLTEELYLLNKLVKGAIGTNNIDANSRLCMASAALGYKTSTGEDGAPGCYEDIEHADCFLIAGSNAAECHPVIFRRILERKKQNPKAKILVVDPRKTPTAKAADIHLQITPGTDVALFNAMLHVIVTEKLADEKFIKSHTEGFEEVKRVAEKYTPEIASTITGVDASLIREAARIYADAKASLSLWAMGLNQSSSGVAKNNCIINLALATGNIGKPGAAPFSLTGQCNAMGLREAGALSHLLPGYRSVASSQHRKEMEKIWGLEEGKISPSPGLTAVEIFQAAERGEIKALYICATNPAVSLPDSNRVENALRRVELAVVQDAYFNETSRFAHVLLPAAQWTEKEGTMTSSERRVSYLPKIAEPVGKAKPDWEIFQLFAQKLGYSKLFNYTNPEEIFEEYKVATRGRQCDLSGMSYSRLRSCSLQWPCPEPGHQGMRRLYTDLNFPTGSSRAVFHAHEYREPEENTSQSFPFILVTGRIAGHWHTLTRTGKIPALNTQRPFAEMNPEDALLLGIEGGEAVELASSRGRAAAKAVLTSTVPRGVVFMPFHWGGPAFNNTLQPICSPVLPSTGHLKNLSTKCAL